MIDSEFSRLDEVHVQVLFGPHPGQPASTVYAITIPGQAADGPPWDETETVSELLGLTRAPVDGPGLQNAYDLSVSRRHFSWGADAASAQVILYIAEHALDDATAVAVAAATTETLRRITTRVRSLRPASQPPGLGDQRAAAIRAITRAYTGILGSDPELELREESRTSSEWEGRFRAVDGSHYTVKLGPSLGSDPVRISRQAPRRNTSPVQEAPLPRSLDGDTQHPAPGTEIAQ